MAHQKRSGLSSRRDAPTERGRNVKEAVKVAARRLLEERWVDQISLVEVAKAAKVARASLLLQFPQGWPEILYEIYFDEFPYEATYDRMIACRVGAPIDRVTSFLAPILTRAEQSGRLFANIRGAMFTWGDEFQNMGQYWADDCSAMILDLMLGSRLAKDEAHVHKLRVIAESLYYACLDLASTEWRYGGDWSERQTTLRIIVQTALSGSGLSNGELTSVGPTSRPKRQGR